MVDLFTLLMTKCFFILEILIMEGMAAYKTQFEINQEARYRKVGNIIWSHFILIFFKKVYSQWLMFFKTWLTTAQYFLENYLQHPKKSYFSDKKAQKSVKKLERKYCNNNLCIIDTMQICNSSIHHVKYFLGNWSWNFKVRVWKKAWFDTPT